MSFEGKIILELCNAKHFLNHHSVSLCPWILIRIFVQIFFSSSSPYIWLAYSISQEAWNLICSSALFSFSLVPMEHCVGFWFVAVVLLIDRFFCEDLPVFFYLHLLMVVVPYLLWRSWCSFFSSTEFQTSLFLVSMEQTHYWPSVPNKSLISVNCIDET